jgi:hypothetical protein
MLAVADPEALGADRIDRLRALFTQPPRFAVPDPAASVFARGVEVLEAIDIAISVADGFAKLDAREEPVVNIVRPRTLLYAALADDSFRAVPGMWPLWRCAGCDCAYLDPRPDRASIGEAYRRYYTHEPAAASHCRGIFVIADGVLKSWIDTEGLDAAAVATRYQQSVAAA